MTQRIFVVGLLALGAAALGCSLLTKPEQGDVRCSISDDNIDPCPAGMYCLKDTKTCKPEPECDEHTLEKCNDHQDNDCDDKVDEENQPDTEICDTQDNDCDGRTDEEFDADGDESTVCGTGNFEVGSYDCEPNIKEVHPGAKEVCDGLDNDCDGKRDVSSTPLCGANEECLDGRCVVPSCAVPNAGVSCKATEKCVDAKCVEQACSPACKTNEFCEMVGGTFTCVAQAPKKAGDPCVVDNDCDQTTAKLLCFDRAALGLTPTPTRGVCSIGCCTDTDCGPNETCYVSGLGTRSCLPKTLAVNVATPARCTVNENCAQTTTCAAGLLGTGDLATTICRTPVANSTNERKIGEPCLMSSQCASRMCVDGNIFQQLCTAPCRDSSDCKPLEEPSKGLYAATPYCQYAKLGDIEPKFGANYAPICVVARGTVEIGSGKNGTECYVNRECASGVCIGVSAESKGRCAQTCCGDAQCGQGAPGVPPTRCQPVARGQGRFEMRCLVR